MPTQPRPLRVQYQVQLDYARALVAEHRRPLTLVMVYWRGYPTRISIIGNAISSALPAIWKAQGARIRTLTTIRP